MMLEFAVLSVAVLALLLLAPIVIFCAKNNPWSQCRTLGFNLFGARKPAISSSEIVSLRVYPIKSCRGIELKKSTLLTTGLDLDRQWMFIDPTKNEFLTIRQIPQMTLINTALTEDGETLLLSVAGDNEQRVVRIPAHPSAAWLADHTTLETVKIWDTVTDGYVYGPEVNELFSVFLARPVCLVYKGPKPRVLQGNGDPRLLGRKQTTNFPDVHPVLIGSEASIAELNARLQHKGVDPITIERFRPNIIVAGNAPWTEDSWKLVRISPQKSSSSSSSSAAMRQRKQKPLEIDILARCARCQVPNVEPSTAQKHTREPWDTLMSYRRVDEGMKWKPCFGMLSAPRNEGPVEVGMLVDVLEETTQHRYISGF
ncbi:hypothetical protein ASPZODRAFT_144049 [Penicilliopsis zonata CBS 506.65]|uniref:MOSC domain-containing protein n=1 Tax=Penicilliopsis zonata CBS 506.65 TaxID=1073090 RepID=A0A1L9SE94_9EURO|nr:hypothetical protein ASPZODRAFT_144049 [Penicilliopsis zonata CBS 506.65]OJJ45417.1 hypothetical protein ASPZODRAFT_144049 [Penicilliopsis zonata CBS 506.65]